MTSLIKVVKAVVGILVLLLLAFLISRWYAEYRSGGKAAETTSTATPSTSTPASKPNTLTTSEKQAKVTRIQILMDGVNFRVKPESNAEVIRGLNRGENLTLLKKQGNWYNCKDSKGVAGWLSANASYSKILP